MGINDRLAIIFSLISIVLGIITAFINHQEARDFKEASKEQHKVIEEKYGKFYTPRQFFKRHPELLRNHHEK